MIETYEQQQKDADMIFKQIMAANFDSWDEAQIAIVRLYIPDRSISRAGISAALERIERHYKK